MNQQEIIDLINFLDVEDIVKAIMGRKEDIGDFSLDLYYNDLAEEGQQFVAKMHPSDVIWEPIHVRAGNFHQALASIIFKLQFHSSILRKLKAIDISSRTDSDEVNAERNRCAGWIRENIGADVAVDFLNAMEE